MPFLTVIAGPNGSGKSTFAASHQLQTIDPDRIAAGFGAGFTPEANVRASRVALQQIHERLEKRQSLTVETTLAGGQPLRLMARAKETGYTVHLIFILANSREDTRLRIDNRVLLGGHNISDADLQRRTPRILAHLPEALTLAHLSAIYVSSVVKSDFRLEGVFDENRLELTPEIPAPFERIIAARFPVLRVPEISSQRVENVGLRLERGWNA